MSALKFPGELLTALKVALTCYRPSEKKEENGPSKGANDEAEGIPYSDVIMRISQDGGAHNQTCCWMEWKVREMYFSWLLGISL